MSSAEDRRTKRALVNKDVVINGIIKAEALDLSIDGLYIYTKSSFIPGTIFEVSFKIGEETLTTMARVQHAQPGIGIGVKFVELSAKNSETIKKHIEG